MSELITLHLEHAVYGKETQNAAECVGVGADGRREFGGGSGGLVQHVRDAEVGDDVKTSRQAIATRNLYQRSDRIRLNHTHSCSSPCLL